MASALCHTMKKKDTGIQLSPSISFKRLRIKHKCIGYFLLKKPEEDDVLEHPTTSQFVCVVEKTANAKRNRQKQIRSIY